MHRLTFDPGQRRVLLLVHFKMNKVIWIIEFLKFVYTVCFNVFHHVE
jgi:hypothetical protein